MPAARSVPLALLLAFALGCNRDTPQPAAAPTPAPALLEATTVVKVTSPSKQSLAWVIEQPGSVLAFEVTPVVAKLPGYVTKMHVDRGDKVVGPTFGPDGRMTRPGTLLAEISIPELTAEAKQKAAEVERFAAEVTLAKRNVDVASEQIASVQASVAEAKAGLTRVAADIDRWASELKRIEGLVSGRLVDSQTLDETRKQYKTAAAAREEADARIASAEVAVREARAKKARAEADVLTAESRRKVAEADAERVNALLGYTAVRAPFSGIVTERHRHTGHFLQSAGDKPDPLFVIARLDTLRVVVDVPEAGSDSVRVGNKAVVKFPALGNREVSGTVSRTSGVLSPESRTLRVEIDLKNEDESLKPGLFAVVKITAGGREAMTLPAAAVLFADETAYCFAIRDGKAVKMRVRTGRTEGGNIEVLGKRPATTATGEWEKFDGTEKVVVGNLGALADGQTVSESK